MTTVTELVDNAQNGALLEKMRRTLSFVETVNVDHHFLPEEPKGSYEKLKKAIEKAEEQDLLTDIDDPSKWQKNVRDEW